MLVLRVAVPAERDARATHNRTAALTCNALGMAFEQRDAVRGTVIDSDHGTQFTAWTFSERARR